MAETVVHVTTIEEWKAVLDVWFKQGYKWPTGDKEYDVIPFENGGRFLHLGDYYISYSINNPDSKPFVEYPEFIKGQKEDNKMETYYVAQEQLDLIEELKGQKYPLYKLLNSIGRYQIINFRLNSQVEKALLRYLGGDETIEFKVKEPLYRLWAIDEYGEKVYFKQSHGFWTAPATQISEDIFTAPLEEIKKWQTPAWEIEEVK